MAQKIMIVEDEKDILEVYGEYLSAYDITLCSTAGESLEKIKEVNPDLLIVDLGLPDMDGMTFIEKVRADFSEQLPVIIISGKIDIEYCIKANVQGITDLITKTFEKSQLIDLVKKKVSSKK